MDVRGKLPVIHCKKMRIFQVFENLIQNSVKYMGDSESPVIEVGCKETDGFLALEPRFEVNLFESGEDALQYLEGIAKNDWPAAILLDYSLPGIDGLTQFKHIVENGYDMPVIIVTGKEDEIIAVKAMKKGAFDYVVKAGNYWADLPPSYIRL